MEIKKINNFKWKIEKSGNMRVPAYLYGTMEIVESAGKEKALKQVVNVACLPGIVEGSFAMPDIHWGYGFPIGGVAAFSVEDGIISPGGIGYDINCGVRLLSTNLKISSFESKIYDIAEKIFKKVPSGIGSCGAIKIRKKDLKEISEKGSRWALENGFALEDDLDKTEENGCMKSACSENVSSRAFERGLAQVGTLGAGNHFIEIQKVEEVFDRKIAEVLTIEKDSIAIMIHTGSRGFGYQICDDNIGLMQKAVIKYGIEVPDRQLCCAPINSQEGKTYFSAMACGANYAWVNRQMITYFIRQAFKEAGFCADDVKNVYDIAHNIGKIEKHKGRKVMLHRKGATRAFAAGSTQIPKAYVSYGQPVIVPGTMGTASYILCGTQKAMDETFGSVCHGAGRLMSRSTALESTNGKELKNYLENRGIKVFMNSYKTLAEETPNAYKNIDEVITSCEGAGIANKVAKLVPLAVIKG
ncbi:MAG: RtcB family protein [Endomicrobium sp.]|jgi:tRNA-splicing ligase RtcB|nr:RtcB family protein [Endomicrobium sp.]